MAVQAHARHVFQAVLLSAALPAVAAADAFIVTRIADGVYAHQGQIAEANPGNHGDIANFGFVIGQRCVAVIDTGGSLTVGQELLAAIRKRTTQPVCYVINTHIHPDHVFGNAAFMAESNDVHVVGHAHAPAALAARRNSYLASLTAQIGADQAQGSALIPPDLLIPGGVEKTLDLGGRSLRVRAWPTAHTNADLTILDSASQTLWTGDLLFVNRIPVIDGSLRGWLTTMDRLAMMDPAHVVPGHGPFDPPWRVALADQRRYLDTLEHDVRVALKNHRTLAQTVESAGLSERGRWPLFEDYHRRNVTAAYTELEWEN